VGNNKELYADFNSPFEGKLLIMVEEANSADNHCNNDYLKSKITSKKMNVNKKNVSQYTVNDYANYMFCSNNRNPLPIKQGNRRMAVFDTNPAMRGNEKYFTDLWEHLEKWAFYQYLKNYETYKSPIEFQISIPNTSAYREIRSLNAPIYLKWLVYELRNGTLEDDSISELYKNFKLWVKEHKEGKEDTLPSITSFGITLNKSKEANKDFIIENVGHKTHTNLGNVMRWDIDGVIVGLQKLFLLEEGFEYNYSNPTEANLRPRETETDSGFETE
jgi:hypothetical protein